MTRAERIRAATEHATAIEQRQRQDDPREVLRAVARLCEQRDPEQLAELPSDINGTLTACARLQFWLKRYAQALRRRQPQ